MELCVDSSVWRESSADSLGSWEFDVDSIAEWEQGTDSLVDENLVSLSNLYVILYDLGDLMLTP